MISSKNSIAYFLRLRLFNTGGAIFSIFFIGALPKAESIDPFDDRHLVLFLNFNIFPLTQDMYIYHPPPLPYDKPQTNFIAD